MGRYQSDLPCPTTLKVCNTPRGFCNGIETYAVGLSSSGLCKIKSIKGGLPRTGYHVHFKEACTKSCLKYWLTQLLHLLCDELVGDCHQLHAKRFDSRIPDGAIQCE